MCFLPYLVTYRRRSYWHCPQHRRRRRGLRTAGTGSLSWCLRLEMASQSAKPLLEALLISLPLAHCVPAAFISCHHRHLLHEACVRKQGCVNTCSGARRSSLSLHKMIHHCRILQEVYSQKKKSWGNYCVEKEILLYITQDIKSILAGLNKNFEGSADDARLFRRNVVEF